MKNFTERVACLDRATSRPASALAPPAHLNASASVSALALLSDLQTVTLASEAASSQSRSVHLRTHHPARLRPPEAQLTAQADAPQLPPDSPPHIPDARSTVTIPPAELDSLFAHIAAAAASSAVQSHDDRDRDRDRDDNGDGAAQVKELRTRLAASNSRASLARAEAEELRRVLSDVWPTTHSIAATPNASSKSPSSHTHHE